MSAVLPLAAATFSAVVRTLILIYVDDSYLVCRFLTHISGFQLSPRAMKCIMRRYSLNGQISFDNFVSCSIRIRCLTDHFQKRDGARNGNASFQYDDVSFGVSGIPTDFHTGQPALSVSVATSPQQDPLYGYFSAVAGQDGQISADELQRCLTQSGISGSYQPFSLETCRLMINMLDVSFAHQQSAVNRDINT
ncbi:hypothetical protein F2P81_016607 [Scophthalmus maximus]|uniref:EF-hand domain-containing protein n=1 Tax=Scophthalmus maximus TaxID=52904 RepID=A0A6A4SNZ3_SCOMX|nr:hypothetical protein F2P81_016607 [Scophthalmus maximus]